MKPLCVTLIALPALAVLSAGHAAKAAPRESSLQDLGGAPQEVVDESDTSRSAQIARMSAWLKRLEGRFRYEGIVDDPGAYCYLNRKNNARVCVGSNPKTGRGLGDCVLVGDGPGLHCVLNLNWEESGSLSTPPPGSLGASLNEFPDFAPTMLLYGIDPVTLGIRYLQADDRGLVEVGQGALKGNAVTFRAPCLNMPASLLCTRVTRIYANSDASVIRLWLDIEAAPGSDGIMRVAGLTFDLHRVAPDEDEEVLQGLPGAP